MGTNPNQAVGTNGAYGGRTSVNAFNDVLGAFTGPGIVSGWQVAPQSGMTIAAGGVGVMRDVAIAEDPVGNRTTINNRFGTPVPVEIPAASATSNRIDCVVAYVNSPATVNSTTLDNPEAVGLIDVKGTTSAPDDEAIRAAITADGGTGTTAYYVILATISVPAGTTVITQNLITQGAMVMTRVLNGAINSSMIDWETIREYATTTDGGRCYKIAGLNIVVWNTVAKTPDTRYHAVGFDTTGSGINNIIYGHISVRNDAASEYANHIVRMNSIRDNLVQGIVVKWNPTNKTWDSAPNKAINFFAFAIGF